MLRPSLSKICSSLILFSPSYESGCLFFPWLWVETYPKGIAWWGSLLLPPRLLLLLLLIVLSIFLLIRGAKNGMEAIMFYERNGWILARRSLHWLLTRVWNWCTSRRATYTNVEFNNTPENKHRWVSISMRDPVDLCETKNRTYGCKKAKKKQATKTKLLRFSNLQA